MNAKQKAAEGRLLSFNKVLFGWWRSCGWNSRRVLLRRWWRCDRLEESQRLWRRNRASVADTRARKADLVDLLLESHSKSVKADGHAAKPIRLRFGEPALLI